MRRLLVLLLLPGAAFSFPTPDTWWSVNGNGRSDDDFYEHVNGTAETSTGTTSVDTAGSRDGLDYGGTTSDYTDLTETDIAPNALVAGGDWTIAVRFKTGAVSAVAQLFSLTNALSGHRAGLELHSNGDIRMQLVDGTNTIISGNTTVTEADDGAEHVAVMTYDQSAGEIELFYEDALMRTRTITAVTTDFDTARLAARLNSSSTLEPFGGTIIWAATWNSELTLSEIQELDDSADPYMDLLEAAVPTLSNAVPSDFKVGSADISADSDTTGSDMDCVVTDSSSQPSEAQIVAGNDHTGSAAEAHPTAITVAGATTTFNDVSISAGLWYAHCVQDGSDVISTAQFRVAGDSDGPDEWFGTVAAPASCSVLPIEALDGDVYFVDRVAGTDIEITPDGCMNSGSSKLELNARIWDASAGALSTVENTVYLNSPLLLLH